MPVKSPEAIARRKQRARDKARSIADAKRALALPKVVVPKLPAPPSISSMSKSELRAMLTLAIENTARMT